MATNSGSSNPIGEAVPATNNVQEATPVSQETKDAIAQSAEAHASTDGVVLGADGKPKSAKQLEKERQKAEKAARFAAKKAAQDADKAKQAAQPKKEKKAKKEEVNVEPYVELTKPGDKKVLQDLELPALKNYDPQVVESAWYSWWEKSGFFEPEFGPDGKPKPEGTFVVPAPPPNVTGALHIGHALTIAIQDTLVRWNRMLGKTVLFLPGFDHAGLSCQSAVEKRLWVQEKKTRHDYGRKDFIDIIWKWKDDYHSRITGQLKRLGASYDWTREAFTMDENLSAAVVETFVRLHEEGIIYRANRLVNWCTQLNTTLSNLEVDQKEISGRTLLSVPGYDPEDKVEFGAITSFAYEIEASDEKIIVATTRPETMLGDTAVAVHPDDERYKHLHGKFVKHPFVDRKIPIVCDSIVVDMAFGTGAVKITPAHDPNDYEVGKRHNLEFINILNDDGTLNNTCGEFTGMKRFHARKAVVEKLTERGLFVEVKDNPMSIPVCSKSGDIIEPVLKPQWWVSQQAMADVAAEAVRSGQIKIQPAVSEADFQRWMENVQDWCISRQLWWGHQAPVYYVQIEGEEQDRGDGKWWVSGRTKEAAQEKAEKQFPGKKFELIQDEDVLDTWFSSGLWPFSTLGWPKVTPDYENFYPTSLLETGWDILFFWVARMVMLGIKLTGQVPFKEVFCHSLVRDAQGRKMSKTLGNVVDPIDMIEGISLDDLHAKLLVGNLDPREIEKAKTGQKLSYPNGIPQCGTDALRFAFCAYTTGGRDINLDVVRVEGYRKFCNKIYNATKFALMRLGPDFVPAAKIEKTGKESLVERWILHKYNKAAKDINKHLEARNFFEATNSVYNYWLYELCDVYIENSKYLILEGTEEQKISAQQTLYTCLDGALRMIHPFMPYVTEELWQRIPRRPQDSTPTIVKAAYPVYNEQLHDPEAETNFELVFSVVKGARSLMAEYNVLQGAKIFVQADASINGVIAEQSPSIVALIKGCESCEVLASGSEQPEGCAVYAINKDCNALLLVKGHADLDAEIAKAEKKIGKIQQQQAQMQKLLAQKDYENKVPENVRAQNAEKLETMKAETENLDRIVAQFKKLLL
ncbi:hypothetical protein SAICODRAFT_60694 [Saitoella complicata NRRL Y-17804]|nr:uncharacterized protein SAICODRAFT_60694 [Saitoella complicata NRRL Y-17804]ODQ51028.1 hypothetical protein SAICODRAFT_60694 [Saitoella complicata NRRL Y-17804]